MKLITLFCRGRKALFHRVDCYLLKIGQRQSEGVGGSFIFLVMWCCSLTYRFNDNPEFFLIKNFGMDAPPNFGVAPV